MSRYIAVGLWLARRAYNANDGSIICSTVYIPEMYGRIKEGVDSVNFGVQVR